MGLEKAQIYSLGFLVLFILPAVFYALSFLPIPGDLMTAAILALLFALPLRYLIKNEIVFIAVVVVSALLAPTLSAYFASPISLASGEMARHSVTTTPQEIAVAKHPLGAYSQYVQLFSLLRQPGMIVYGISKRDITDPAAVVRKESNMFPSLTFGPSEGPMKLLLVSVKRKVKGVVQKVELPVLVPLPDEDAKDRTLPAWHPDYEPTEEELKPPTRGMRPLEPDHIWLAGDITPVDVDVVSEKQFAKKAGHVRPFAIVSRDGGGLGRGAEPNYVGALTALCFPVVLALSSFILESLVGKSAGVDATGASTGRARFKKRDQ